jgi:hypothetical protein
MSVPVLLIATVILITTAGKVGFLAPFGTSYARSLPRALTTLRRSRAAAGIRADVLATRSATRPVTAS